MTDRPRSIDAGEHTKDDGFYGPDSVTWRVAAHPVLGIAATAAATIQMLLPRVMHMVDQASSFREHPDLRAQRTGEFGATVYFGDTETAERAGEVLRRIHASCKAVDPRTGETYQADEPELLLWVHNALTWAIVRGTDIYGPSLDADEHDRFVAEQKVMARMVGIDPDVAPDTWSGLQDYMRSMLPQLAYGTDTRWFKEMVIPSGLPTSVGGAVKNLMGWGSVTLYEPEHRDLFGIRWNGVRQFTTVAAVKAILAPIAATPVDEMIPQFRQFVDENAFGARKRKVSAGPRGETDS